MEKIKVFFSSRVNSVLKGLPGNPTLTDLRHALLADLEKQTFLDQLVLEVLINEENFNASIATNAFESCMRVLRGSNIIIILYNGEAGWSVAGAESTNGICHEELLAAMNEFSDMTFMLDLTAFADLPAEGDAFERNLAFTTDIINSFLPRIAVPATTMAELTANCLTQIKQYILAAINKAMTTQKSIVAGSSIFGETLDWSKLSYAERKEQLEEKMEAVFAPLATFAQVIRQYYGIPDHMSVAEARNLVGRPFLKEQDQILGSDLACGIIHFVGVYGNVTEGQAKNLVGYPDLTVIKAPFGLYLWEKNTHIQLFFLKGCINPQTVKTRFSEVTNWLSGSREQGNIIARAKARYAILEVINSVKNTK